MKKFSGFTAFRLPGVIKSFKPPHLYSEVSLMPDKYPVRSTLPIRTNASALADFFFTPTLDIAAGEFMTVSGPPYKLKSGGKFRYGQLSETMSCCIKMIMSPVILKKCWEIGGLGNGGT